MEEAIAGEERQSDKDVPEAVEEPIHVGASDRQWEENQPKYSTRKRILPIAHVINRDGIGLEHQAAKHHDHRVCDQDFRKSKQFRSLHVHGEHQQRRNSPRQHVYQHVVCVYQVSKRYR